MDFFVSNSTPQLMMCFHLPPGHEAVQNRCSFLLDQEVTQPAILSVEESVSLGLFFSSHWDQSFDVKLGFLQLIFVLDGSQTASSSRVANGASK